MGLKAPELLFGMKIKVTGILYPDRFSSRSRSEAAFPEKKKEPEEKEEKMKKGWFYLKNPASGKPFERVYFQAQE